MYKNILIATDGSDLANKAVLQGLSLAKALQASVLIITVTEAYVPQLKYFGLPTSFDEYDESVATSATKILAFAEEEARKLGVACTIAHIAGMYPADGIVTEANTKKCDLIVMASHGFRGIERLLLGSQALAVLTHSKVPVLICR